MMILFTIINLKLCSPKFLDEKNKNKDENGKWFRILKKKMCRIHKLIIIN